MFSPETELVRGDDFVLGSVYVYTALDNLFDDFA